jgi:hypothetical protein
MRIISSLKYFRNPKLEVDNIQLTCISIEKLGQVLLSVGWLLGTRTDPWWLSGWFLGFIATVLKKSETGKFGHQENHHCSKEIQCSSK